MEEGQTETETWVGFSVDFVIVVIIKWKKEGCE